MIQSPNNMKLIKPSMIALAILGLAALIAIGGLATDLPPVLCDAERCACSSNLESQLGNQLYCVKHEGPIVATIETYSLGCIDYLRFCKNGDLKLCHRGPCTPADKLLPERCIRPIK